MEHLHPIQASERRDEAIRRLNRLTTGAALAAVAGVGVFAVISASTIPGKAASTPTPGSSSDTTSSATANDDSSSAASSSSSSSNLQPSSGVSSAPTGSGVVVSGASH